jgi:hypothetical protein
MAFYFNDADIIRVSVAATILVAVFDTFDFKVFFFDVLFFYFFLGCLSDSI